MVSDTLSAGTWWHVLVLVTSVGELPAVLESTEIPWDLALSLYILSASIAGIEVIIYVVAVFILCATLLLEC